MEFKFGNKNNLIAIHVLFKLFNKDNNSFDNNDLGYSNKIRDNYNELKFIEDELIWRQYHYYE
jgi:hypothetical protein